MLDANRAWRPIRIGESELRHRIAMCPLTRRRSPGGVPNALVQEYYRQRADGNLIFTEGTFIAAEAGGLPGAPGIYSQEQVQAWKRVVDAVHERNGVIFCQLWALGRVNIRQMITYSWHLRPTSWKTQTMPQLFSVRAAFPPLCRVANHPRQ